ncbi:hypothetical protein ACOA8Y_000562 [Serratia marcescens]
MQVIMQDLQEQQKTAGVAKNCRSSKKLQEQQKAAGVAKSCRSSKKLQEKACNENSIPILLIGEDVYPVTAQNHCVYIQFVCAIIPL